MKKYALISLSDKTNLEILVKKLIEKDYEIIASTSTNQAIKDLGYEVKLVEDITAYPEMLNGRVKTLQPEIHGGILADLDNQDHVEDLKKHKINPISLVVCNLYPFDDVLEQEIQKMRDLVVNKVDITTNINAMESNIIENIDIGGITLLRAAAKNYKHVSVLCDPNDYQGFVDNLDNLDLSYKSQLAAKAFNMCALYDISISNYFMSKNQEFSNLLVGAKLKQELRYGENPQQNAYYFEKEEYSSYSISSSIVKQGKELSYNNMLDIDAAYDAMYEFEKSCVIALKHNTICGIGLNKDALSSYLECLGVDDVSIFGGIIIFNRPIYLETALELNKIFLEIVIAPEFSDEALNEFKKKPNLRVIKGDFNKELRDVDSLKSVNGGYLYQDKMIDEFELECVTKHDLNDEDLTNLSNLYKTVKNVKSNGIVIGSNKQVLGISGGMVSRIDALNFALSKVKNNIMYQDDCLYLASDGFFPFNDVIEIALSNNIQYIIQPGGSLNDQRLIDACNENNIKMVFTKTRFFKH